jgi:plastocyanin
VIRRRPFAKSIQVAGASMIVAACGGSSASPTSTTANPSPTTVTIAIANNAVSPSSVTITRGGTVTFVNNDSRTHDIESNPHPAHTDCPEINQVNSLSSGQSRQTGAFNTARTCGFHDHQQASVSSMFGTITIQ